MAGSNRMEGDRSSLGAAGWLISIMLIGANAFLVAAEYGLIGSRKSRVEALAKKGNRSAKALLGALADVSRYVAGIQIAITICSIGIGAITETQVTNWLATYLDPYAGRALSVFISLLIVTYLLVVIGELVPKYLALKHAEKAALVFIRPLKVFVFLISPLVWLVQKSGAIVLRLFGVRLEDGLESNVSKEELLLLVRAGSDDGMLEETHANLIQRALKFDVLDANDIMVHRLDIHWLDLETPKEELMGRIGKMSHSRVPVCRGDIDDIVGVLYLQDLVRHWDEESFDLEKMLRPVEAIPENLPVNKIITRMRESKSQILIVMDEYGGTSGLITLEDVVEEVFGELEDQMESERPPIERVSTHRISARAEVRLDELYDFLGVAPEGEPVTETLASTVQNNLGRVPKLGDKVALPIGDLRVENMARRRITRVSIILREPASS